MAFVPQVPYSPDLAPSDFLLFPNMKIRFKGRRFDTVEKIQAEMQTVLNTQKGYTSRMHLKCLLFQGEYFEYDGAE
jgi:hypothetical protein